MSADVTMSRGDFELIDGERESVGRASEAFNLWKQLPSLVTTEMFSVFFSLTTRKGHDPRNVV